MKKTIERIRWWLIYRLMPPMTTEATTYSNIPEPQLDATMLSDWKDTLDRLNKPMAQNGEIGRLGHIQIMVSDAMPKGTIMCHSSSLNGMENYKPVVATNISSDEAPR